MSEATIEYKNSPNESTAYVVSEGQKTKVQLVATPAGDLELANNPNVDTGYLVIDGEKHKCTLVAEVDGELKLPTSATDDSGYVTTQDGRQHKVKLVANITGGGTQINNQNINVTQNGIYQPEEGYTGLGTVNVNVASGSPTQKFGATVDMFLGDVNENGMYKRPNIPTVIDLSGVKSFYSKSFVNELAGIKDLVFKANDAISISQSVFDGAFNLINPVSFAEKHYLSISFDSLEELTGDGAFQNACALWSNTSDKEIVNISFKKLKKISANGAFANFGTQIEPDYDTIFPALEEIAGDRVFNGAFYKLIITRTMSNVKKITGNNTNKSSSTFGSVSYKNTVWNFPSATEFTGYIWYISTSYSGEIHFAAANQAAIEACEGYDYKWGFDGATIYFDL